MLELMRRLHRLELQSQLQAESHASAVIYPQVKKHGNNYGKRGFSLKDITNSKIFEAVTTANIKVKGCIEKLGMEVFNLQKDDVVSDENHDSDNDVDDDEQLDQDTSVIKNAVNEVCMEDSSDIEKDIQALLVMV